MADPADEKAKREAEFARRMSDQGPEPESPPGFRERYGYRQIRFSGIGFVLFGVFLLLMGHWVIASVFGVAGALLAIVGHRGATRGREPKRIPGRGRYYQ